MIRRYRCIRLDRALVLLLGLVVSAGCTVQARNESSTALERFAERMAAEHGFTVEEVRSVLADSRRQQDIIDAMERPAEALPWHRYRDIFVKEDRIAAGVEFWADNAALLDRASAAYGVPPEILVAIVGVETRYGTYVGRHRVLDALRTLAFDYPPRSDFFRGELESYLLLTREEGFDPRVPQGSYAGAMGMPQFIPSSYRAYAVDFNDNGQRDLWEELPDVLGSVANYFARHGWRSGGEVAVAAEVIGDDWRRFETNGMKPDTTVGELAAAGVRPARALPSESAARLTVLEGANGDEYWVTLDNFYVITRYNHSPLYAMAVHQLADAIATRREGGA